MVAVVFIRRWAVRLSSRAAVASRRHTGRMEPCPGVLLWFDVPVDDRFDQPAGLLKCSACDFVTVTTNQLDERHREAQCQRVD